MDDWEVSSDSDGPAGIAPPQPQPKLVPQPKPQPRPKAKPKGRPRRPAAVADADRGASIPGTLVSFLRPALGSSAQVAAMRAWARPEEQRAEGERHRLKSLISGCLGPQARPVCSQIMEAKDLDIGRTGLVQRIKDLAAAVHFGSRAFCSSLLSHVLRNIQENNLRPISIFTHVAFDETPMVINLETCAGENGRQNIEVAIPSALRTSAPQQSRKRDVAKATGKIMQFEGHFATLCRAANGRMVLGVAPVVSPPLALQRSNAELIVASIRENLSIPMLGECRRRFPVAIHLTAADRFSGNIKAEAYLRQAGTADWRLNVPCHIHMVHTVQEREMDMIKNLISGLIAFARTQQQTGALTLFREFLADVLRRSVDVYPRSPPEEDSHAEHREHVLSLLLTGSSADQARKVKLGVLLTGNFASERIAWYVGAGPQPDMLAWSRDVAKLLLPRATPVVERHRWMNACPGVDSAALLANIHSLLRRVVPLWIAALKGDGAEGGKGNDDDSESELGESVGPVPRLPTGELDWTAWNAAQRGDAKRFASSSFDGALLVVRVCFQLQIILLHGLEERSSLDWLGRVFQGWAGQGPSTPCRLVDAASLRLTLAYFKKCYKLLVSPDGWLALASHQTIQRESSLAFCLLSRGACAVYQLMHTPNKGFPYKLFSLLRLVGKPSFRVAAQDIQDAPACMLDSFSAQFLRRYRNALESDECLAVLQSIAVLQASRVMHGIL